MIKLAKKAVRRGFRKLGYRLVRHPYILTGKRMSTHEPVVPIATYAPWNADTDFLQTFKTIKENTLVDFYRCWELWTLVQQTAKLSGAIIEIGVWRGGTGALLAKQAAECGIKDPVYLCDTFCGVVKAGSNDTVYKGGEHADTSRSIVENLLFQRMGLENVRLLEGVFPDETAQLIEDDSQMFRLCHIDVDVYDSARDVANWVWDRMVIGGILVFDDYGFRGTEGIVN